MFASKYQIAGSSNMVFYRYYFYSIQLWFICFYLKIYFGA